MTFAVAIFSPGVLAQAIPSTLAQATPSTLAQAIPSTDAQAIPSTGARGVEHSRRAHSARTLSATDTAHLHLVKSPGSLLLEEGSASGTLPGTVKARCVVGPTVTAKFTIYTRAGAISGQGAGKLSSSGGEPSFGGSMTVTGGTGRYAHAHGRGGFYGVLNRRTDAMILQTTGTLSY
jgi:hypothetical protein